MSIGEQADFGTGVTQNYDSGYYAITAEQRKYLELTRSTGVQYFFNGEECDAEWVEMNPGDTLEVYIPEEGFEEITFYDPLPVDNWIQRYVSGFIILREKSSGGGVPS